MNIQLGNITKKEMILRKVGAFFFSTKKIGILRKGVGEYYSGDIVDFLTRMDVLIIELS